MPKTNLEVGKIGEKTAQQYLQKNGYLILAKNYRTRYGEIDIVVQKENKIRFVEVKTRIGDRKGQPYEAVNSLKIKHLQRASQLFLLQNKLKNYKLSLDVISIVMDENLKTLKLDFFENIIS